MEKIRMEPPFAIDLLPEKEKILLSEFAGARKNFLDAERDVTRCELDLERAKDRFQRALAAYLENKTKVQSFLNGTEPSDATA